MPTNMFDNSLEFNQLGTLARNNRTSEYYAPDVTTQPKADVVLRAMPFPQHQNGSLIPSEASPEFPPTTNQEFINRE